MATVVGAITSSHVPAIGRAIAQGPAAGALLETVLRRLSARARVARAGEARRRGDLLQRSRPQLLPRQAADVRRRRRARVPQRRRRLGHSDGAAVRRRPGAVVAPDRVARRRRVRHHDVPGDARRPCGDAADGAALAGRRPMAGAHRADRDEPRPAPAALAASAATRWDRRSAARSTRGTRTPVSSCSARADSRISSTASAPASSTSRSTSCAWTRSSTIRRRLARYSTLDIVREAGAQGTELMAWIAARGALTGRVSKVHSNYHVPISNTATGTMVLENQPRPSPQVRAA